MSAERSMSSSRSARALIAPLLLGIAIGAGGAMLTGLTGSEAPLRVLRAASPDSARIASAIVRACRPHGLCGELRLGASGADAPIVHSLEGHECQEIVWTPDGTRVGFVIDANHVMLYDAATRKHAGTVRLLTDEAAQTRLARGITFSENGRALTFDDCPRGRSGCRAAVVGVPQ
jgi:hypothetical protein